MKPKNNIILCIFILFFSCDQDGTVIVNPESTTPGPNQDGQTLINNLEGDGCSEDNLCYSLDQIYFNFNQSSGYEVDFYKFNNSHLALGANHTQSAIENNFNLKLFNYSYLLGIPATSINDNAEDDVLIFIPSGCYITSLQSESDCCGADGLLCGDDLNNWYPSGCYDASSTTEPQCCGADGELCGDNLNDWIEEDTSVLSEESIVTPILESEELDIFLEGEIKLSSEAFSNVKNVVWSDALGRYNVNYESADQYNSSYLYSQYYDDYNWISLVDPVLYPIYGDVILVDFYENVYRDYIINETIDDEDVLAERRKKFKVKKKYIPDIAPLMYKKTTDCNDNYRQDDEEIVIFDGFVYPNLAAELYETADSFEAYCFSDACSGSDEVLLTEASCCGSDGSLCNGEDAPHTWDSTIVFDVGSDDNLCSTTCNKSGIEETMYQYCWTLYATDSKATGTCTQTSAVTTYYDNEEYDLAFCDRGNNLYDTAEYYVEQTSSPDDSNAYWGTNSDGDLEPLEDRNCNEDRDLAEPKADDFDSYEGNWSNVCTNKSIVGVTEFCDMGNERWDSPETCYPPDQSQDSCSDYNDLYDRSASPNQIIVDYSNQENPQALLDIFPQWDYNDTGADGCFDIFESGDTSVGGNPCLCEFNDYTNLISCEDWLISLGLWDGDTGDGDLNKDGEITEIDIAASPHSPYSYGECKNGFSGSEEACCIYYGCWDTTTDRCMFTDDNCLLDSNEVYWEENLDPNCDNFESNDPDCTSSSSTEFDGDKDPNEQARYYSIVDSNDEDEDGETDDDIIITIEDYFADIDSYPGYSQHYFDTDKITTKILEYSSSVGGDEIEIIEGTYITDNVYDYKNIIESDNRLRSNPVVDQIDFDSDSSNCSSLSESSCENNSEYSWCMWNSSEAECMVDYELFYESVINNYHIVKTEFYDSSGEEDYDYMIFRNTDEHIVKMIHPYYHLAPGGGTPLDSDDFSEDDFWQTVHLEADTSLYTFNGNIANGQSFYSMYSIETDTANYEILKEYAVYDSSTTLRYAVEDPNCITFTENMCNNENYLHCTWDGERCESNEMIQLIEDCLLVTRIVSTTSIGSGMTFKLKSDTYFKPGFDIVQEDLFIHWNDEVPWHQFSYNPISSIQYKSQGSRLETNQTGGFFNNYQLINIDDFENIEDFNFSPYKTTNTFGIQRVEYPIDY